MSIEGRVWHCWMIICKPLEINYDSSTLCVFSIKKIWRNRHTKKRGIITAPCTLSNNITMFLEKPLLPKWLDNSELNRMVSRINTEKYRSSLMHDCLVPGPWTTRRRSLQGKCLYSECYCGTCILIIWIEYECFANVKVWSRWPIFNIFPSWLIHSVSICVTDLEHISWYCYGRRYLFFTSLPLTPAICRCELICTNKHRGMARPI